MDDIILVKAAIKIAGSIRKLGVLSDIDRHSAMRLLSGKTKRLQKSTRDKLERFINAK